MRDEVVNKCEDGSYVVCELCCVKGGKGLFDKNIVLELVLDFFECFVLDVMVVSGWYGFDEEFEVLL